MAGYGMPKGETEAQRAEVQAGLYAGWNTFQTWVANLWLMNDEFLYETVVELVRNASSKRELAYELIELIRDITDYESQNPFTKEIINTFIDNVDWYELAEAYIYDFK